jgi:hypothetical protein
VYDVFISYRWVEPDQTWVRDQLVPALKNAGLAVLLDVEDFVPGRDLILEMTRAGRESRRALCVLSPEYFDENRMVGFESLMARRSDPSGTESRLIPLLLRPTELPEWLRGLIPIDWTNPRDYPREWGKLLKVLGGRQDANPPGAPGSNEVIAQAEATWAAKYYVYLSDAKIKMLYAQISRGGDSQDDSTRNLESVLRELRKAGRIGTVEEPKDYFGGTMPMRWGPYGMSFPREASPLVYFGGVTEQTIVGLGGSAKHVIGNSGSASPHSHSVTPYLIGHLTKELGESGGAADLTSSAGPKDMTLMAVHLATTQMPGPSEELEFVAKRLAYGPSPYPDRDENHGMQVLLGTPLYVAMTG